VSGWLLPSEALVAALIATALVIIGATFARRRTIARGEPLVVCAVRDPGAGRWRVGLARYGATGYDHVVDEGGRLAIDFGVTGPPESYFVDAGGIVRAKQFGPLNEALMDERLTAVGMSR